MKKILFLSLILIGLVSCSKNNAPKPEKLLTELELEEILYEMAIVQSAESQYKTSGDSSLDTYTYVKKRFGVDSLTVVQNNMYYSYDYKNYEKMNERILERLKKLKAEKIVVENKK